MVFNFNVTSALGHAALSSHSEAISQVAEAEIPELTAEA